MKKKSGIIDISDVSIEPSELPPPINIVKTQVRPFLIVKPSAMLRLAEVRTIIQKSELLIDSEFELQDYELLTRYIYKEAPYDWMALNRRLFPHSYNQCYIFLLNKKLLRSYHLLQETKRHVRHQLGLSSITFCFQGEITSAELNHVHTPDRKDLDYEYSTICFLSSTLSIR